MSATRHRRSRHWLTRKLKISIESTFATVRLRTKVIKGPGSRAAGLAIVFKLIKAASGCWRYVNDPYLAALVRIQRQVREGSAHRAPSEAEIKVAARSIEARRPQLLTIPHAKRRQRSAELSPYAVWGPSTSS